MVFMKSWDDKKSLLETIFWEKNKNLANLISLSISLHYLETENCWQRARQATSQTDGTAVDVDSLGFLSSLLETFMMTWLSTAFCIGTEQLRELASLNLK